MITLYVMYLAIFGANCATIIFNEKPDQVRISAAQCLPVDQCPSLKEIAESNSKALDEFERCGFESGIPMVICPTEDQFKRPDPPCDCKAISSCPAFVKLAQERRYAELLSKPRCGFEGREIKLCCPRSRKAIVTESPVLEIDNSKDIVERINPNTVTNKKDNSTKVFSQCGVKFGLKIFGGTAADPHEYPWAAALEYERNGKRNIFCSGVLISDLHVLTAAHCVDEKDSKGYKLVNVRLGHSDITNDWSMSFPVSHVVTHPEYTLVPLIVNDIAMITLQNPVKFTNGIVPVCLPQLTETDEDILAEDMTIISPIVVGWGQTETAIRTNNLQELQVDVVKQSECQEAYVKGGAQRFKIEPTQICARADLGSDSCRGDSGGPLLYVDDESRSFAVGIVSFGTRRCDSSLPGVYTRVSTFIDWIEKIMREDKVKPN